MDQPELDLEQRISQLQTQIDRVNLALHQWRENLESQQNPKSAEERLSELTQQCADILDRWTLTDLRHTKAVAEMEAKLTGWNDLENRFQDDAHQRIRELERKIGLEWDGFRQMFDQPVRQLQEHAVSLRETSVAAASSALTGLERADSRLATLESQMTQLSQEVHTAIVELRRGRAGQLATAGVQPWPLDSVRRLHDEFRGGDADPDAADREEGGPAAVDIRSKRIPLLPESASSLSDRIGLMEKEASRRTDDVKEATARAARTRLASRIMLVVLAVVLGAGAVLAFRLQRQVETRLTEAAARVTAAERQAQAARDLADKQRKDAENQIAAARETALKAQIVSDVLAAPDLVRYSLIGGDTAPRASAQALWSRSRGMVFSALRLPVIPPDWTYQLWLLTNGEPVSAALVVPNSEGLVSIATSHPPDVPRPVLGFVLTLEQNGGRPVPSDRAVLVRRPPEPTQ